MERGRGTGNDGSVFRVKIWGGGEGWGSEVDRLKRVDRKRLCCWMSRGDKGCWSQLGEGRDVNEP